MIFSSTTRTCVLVSAVFLMSQAGVATAATLTVGNDFYRVHVEDAPGGVGLGVYTITTGPMHPSGPGTNVLYGEGVPSTSFNTYRSETTLTDYVQSTSGAITTTSGYSIVSLDSLGSVASVGSNEIKTTYAIFSPDRLLIEVVLRVKGTRLLNSGVEVETTLTNAGTGSVELLARYLADFQVGADDGPTFQPLNVFPPALIGEAEWEPPTFKQFDIQDNDSNVPLPSFRVRGKLEPILPALPKLQLLQYACWPDAFGTAYEYSITPGRDIATPSSPCNSVGGDSAVLYYFGQSSPITIPALGSATVSTTLSQLLPPVPAMSGWGHVLLVAGLVAAFVASRALQNPRRRGPRRGLT